MAGSGPATACDSPSPKPQSAAHSAEAVKLVAKHYADLFGASPVVVDQIRSVAEQSSSNSDLMALGALAAGSFALARKLSITFPTTAWSTYTNLWVVPEAQSGRGKGPMLKQMGMSTIKRWQSVLVDRYADIIRADNRKREVLNEERDEHKQASKKARKAGLLAEHERLEKRIVEFDGRKWHHRFQKALQDADRRAEAQTMGWETTQLLWEHCSGDAERTSHMLELIYTDRMRLIG